MSNFYCDVCGAHCYDTPNGYMTGCEHYPADLKYIEVPTNCISSTVEICPLCSNTKTVTTPAQTTKLSTNPSYRTECHECKAWWYTYKTEFRS